MIRRIKLLLRLIIEARSNPIIRYYAPWKRTWGHKLALLAFFTLPIISLLYLSGGFTAIAKVVGPNQNPYLAAGWQSVYDHSVLAPFNQLTSYIHWITLYSSVFFPFSIVLSFSIFGVELRKLRRLEDLYLSRLSAAEVSFGSAYWPAVSSLWILACYMGAMIITVLRAGYFVPLWIVAELIILLSISTVFFRSLQKWCRSSTKATVSVWGAPLSGYSATIVAVCFLSGMIKIHDGYGVGGYPLDTLLSSPYVAIPVLSGLLSLTVLVGLLGSLPRTGHGFFRSIQPVRYAFVDWLSRQRETKKIRTNNQNKVEQRWVLVLCLLFYLIPFAFYYMDLSYQSQFIRILEFQDVPILSAISSHLPEIETSRFPQLTAYPFVFSAIIALRISFRKRPLRGRFIDAKTLVDYYNIPVLKALTAAIVLAAIVYHTNDYLDLNVFLTCIGYYVLLYVFTRFFLTAAFLPKLFIAIVVIIAVIVSFVLFVSGNPESIRYSIFVVGLFILVCEPLGLTHLLYQLIHEKYIIPQQSYADFHLPEDRLPSSLDANPADSLGTNVPTDQTRTPEPES